MTITTEGLATAPTNHAELLRWVRETAELTQPDKVVWCDGSQQEWRQVTDLLVASGTFVRLNEDKKPNSFYCASDRLSARGIRATAARPTTGWIRTT